MSAPVVVLDNGGYRIRAGYPGESGPRVNTPALVGLSRNKGVAMASGNPEYDVGVEAEERRGLLDSSRPVRAGKVTNWNDMEKLWRHVIYQQLRICPENYCFLITQSANADSKEKEKTLEIMMETFNTQSLYLGAAPVFSLYSYGMTTGTVIDAASDLTSVVPVHEGYALGRHVTQSEVAGEALTSHLSKLLQSKGYGFSTQLERQLVNSVKEELCYVRTSATSEPLPGEVFHLPDGQPIPMEEERYSCPEALFNFGVIGPQYVPREKVFADSGHEFHPSGNKGISWLTYAAINNCESSLRPLLYKTMVLAGGSSLFKGTQERMLSEIVQFYKEMHHGEGLIPIHIQAVASRQYSAWLGGTMLSQLTMFPNLTVSREEYKEHGKRIIHCKNL